MGRYDDVAIVGMSGLFPEASTLDEFHHNLASERDSVRPLSLERMYFTSVDPAHDYTPIGWLDRVDLFDHFFFNISPREAAFMDPHQRLTLQLVCAAVENAGYALDALKGTKTGVFLSAPRPEYQELFTEVDPLELLGNAPSALAGRISYFLDLQGPSFVLDSGCCASLVAVEHACRELSLGESRFAIAGGLSLTLLFEPSSTNAPFAEIMSPDARCKAFDASANGAAAGEGGGIVLLKLLRHAVADGDHVHAVIKGGAINQNGFRSNGLSAPSPAAQKELLLAAWDDAGVDPATISFIEAHGSGTKLGDVIEVQGIKEAFSARGVTRKSCAISSVKTNVGHLDHAAGVAGLIKAVLALEHRTLYRSLNFEKPNPLVDFDEGPIYVQERSVEWDAPPGGVRRAGVSSFSLAGTNVHMVLEEAPSGDAAIVSGFAPEPEARRFDPRRSRGDRGGSEGHVTRDGAGPELVTVSARSETAFDGYREALAGFVEATELSLETIAHTLNRGRSDYEYRAAAVVAGRAELLDWLRSAAPVKAGSTDVAILFSGDVDPDPSALQELVAAYPGARSIVETLEQTNVDLSSREGRAFTYHLAVYAALKDLGLHEIAVMGSGAGNAAVKFVRSEVSAADAARMAGELGRSGDIDTARLAVALKTLDPARTLFVETVRAGGLGRAIASLRPGEARIVDVEGDPRAAVVHAYELGATIDWERHYRDRDVPRAQLPTYPFDEERCWCRPPGEHRDSSPGHDMLVAPPAGGENVLGSSFATDTQIKLAAIWNEALGVICEDASADYFELGGTSITGMAVLNGIERDFGTRLTFQELYEHSRFGDLALRIDELVAGAGDEVQSEPELVPIPRGGHLPVSIGQEQIWFIDQLEPNTPLYNIPFDLHIRGPLDEGALEKALGLLAARHEVLRTSFVNVEGSARAVVDHEVVVEMPVVDISHLPAGERRDEGLRLWEEEAGRPFDLARGPLFRTKLLRLSPDDHVLLMTIHHIIYDGWTPSIIQDELAALYDETANGRPAGLPELPIQYADYADWQRRWADSEAMARELAYWRDHLDGAPALDLPTDHVRPPTQTYRGEMITFELDGALIDSLRALSRSHGVTLFTTMTAAVCILMQRYSGQDDVVIGTPTSGRKRAGIRGLIGYFNNMLPVRCDLSGDPTFTELMQRVRDVVAGALDHDEVPFEKMVHALRPNRDLARNPLFQVAYSHQNAPQEGYTLPGMDVSNFAEGSIRGIAPGTSKFDLTIGVGDGGEGELEGYFEYAMDLFERSTIEGMISNLEQLLRSIEAKPDARLSHLDVVSPEQARRLTDEARGRIESFDLTPVHEAVAARAGVNPDAVAVRGDEVLTYSELETRANRLAHHLVALGVAVEDRVAVVLPRSTDLIVAQLAAMKAGAAYVAVDPEHPAARVEATILDSGAAAVITRSDVSLQSTVARVLLDRDAELIASEPADRPRVRVHPDNAAYVIYTSGSTGAPKGVVVTHRSLANLCGWHAAAYSIDQGDRALFLAPLAFDATVWETWPYLAAGASIHLVTDDERIDPAALRRRIVRDGITVAFASTGMTHALVEGEWDAPTLRALLTGGDRLLKRPAPSFPARLVNHYGPTENTVVATAGDVPPGGADLPTIGKPIHNVGAYVLDAGLEPVPFGARGELFLSGAGLARGYLGSPDLTAERFLPDPFSERPGARMYATGDVVRRRPGGELEFLGRRDHQVKVRGFRVELGEIERALATHPEVAEAVVTASMVGDSTRLVAHVEERVPGEASPDEILRFVAGLLPSHMVPAAVVPVRELPRTATGKVDRSTLPAAEQSPPASSAYRAPRDATERALASIWSEVLGVSRVGIDDNFFDLGGDSILSIQIVARAAAAGLRIGAKDMFRAQTVEALAECARTEEQVVPAEQGRLSGPLPLTPIQRWFLEQAPGEPNRFDQTAVLEVPAAVDGDALKTAFGAVAGHHDALRLRVAIEGDAGRAHIAEDAAEIFRVVDATELALGIEEAAEDLRASIDLKDGPIAGAALVRASEGVRLVVVIHHFAVDAVSWPILVDDLASAYESARHDAPVSLPPKTTSVLRWAARLEELASSGDLHDEARLWTGLAARPGGRVIVDRDGTNLAGAAATIETGLDGAVTKLLTEVAAPSARTTIPEVLLGCLGVALGPVVDGPSLYVDVEGHGREHVGDDVDVSRTVGWFTSIFPVRVDVQATVTTAVADVKEQLRALPRHGMGFGLLKYLTRQADLQSFPRPEVSFNYLGRYVEAGDTTGFTMTGDPTGASVGPANRRAHVIDVEAQIQDGRLLVTWTYSQALHDRASIERLARLFDEALRAFVEEASAEGRTAPTPADFPLADLDARSLDAIVSRLGDVEDVYPLSAMQQGLLFHSLFDPASGVYLEQLNFTVSGPLDPERFERAWRIVAERHEMLHSAVVWDGLVEPVHVIRRDAAPPVSFEDLSSLDAEAQSARLSSYFAEDVRRGFDLSTGPLTRIALFRHEPDVHRIVWTHHHLILDGWSVQLILGELFAVYGDLTNGEPIELEPAGSYRDFIAWLRRPDDRDESAAFWRRELAGVDAPHLVPLRAPEDPQEGFELAVVELSVAESRALEDAARAQRLTLATLVHAAWAQLLGLYEDTDDVVFGAVVAGRPADLPGVERTVGLFINTIPIRVRWERGARAGEWTGELQDRLIAARRFEHSSLVELQSYTGVPAGSPLFETVIAFENYPLDAVWDSDPGGVGIESDRYVEQTNYPLAVVVAPGDRLTIRISYDRGRVAGADVERLSRQFVTILMALATDPPARLGDTTWIPPDEIAELHAASRAPEAPAAVDEVAFVAPRTRTEDMLASIWAEVLDLDKVGALDSFFLLGGHSLVATRVVSRIAEVLGAEIPVRAVFDHPVLEDLAAFVASVIGGEKAVEEIASTVAELEGMTEEEVAALLATMTAEDAGERPS